MSFPTQRRSSPARARGVRIPAHQGVPLRGGGQPAAGHLGRDRGYHCPERHRGQLPQPGH